MGIRSPRGTGSERRVVAVVSNDATLGEVRTLVGASYPIVSCRSDDEIETAILAEETAAVFVESEGLELLAKLAELRPDTRRILISRGDDPAGLDDALDRSEVDYVARPPLARQHIIKAVELLLASFEREQATQSLRSSIRQSSRREVSGEENGDLDRALRQLRVPTYRDPCTRLYTAESFYERVREEVARARRYRKPLTLIQLDIDEFAAFNEKHGEERGDQALAELASILRATQGEARVRESDIVGRVGGEEFALLLPETDRAGGAIKAERVRSAVASWSEKAGAKLTVSVGVAAFPDDARGPAELIQASIGAQRQARDEGGNRVVRTSGTGDARLAHERLQFTYYHGHLDEITSSLEQDRSVSVLFCDLSHLRRIEREFGVSAHAELFARAGELLADTRGACLRREDRLFRTEDADGYLCFLAPPRDHEGLPAPLDLETIAKRVQNALQHDLTKDIEKLSREPVRVVVGYARALANPMARSERVILRVIADARESARLMGKRRALKDKAVLQEIILREKLCAVYQPIVQLESGDIFGFEALTRGPAETSLESPVALFGIADEVDLTFELDRDCFRGALRSAVGLSPVHRLFVNLLPQSFYDTRFIEGEVERLLESAGLTPANVVFEITERLAIENFSAFRDALETYTSMGFGVAIDDVGTRHSNLETVMALQPHFIKVSDVLTRGVSTSTVKREMLRSLQRIADAIDAVIVAEGIEGPADLEILVELGIRYGQGFYLARPAPAFPEILLERQREVRAMAADPRNRRTAQLEVVRLHDDEQTAEHSANPANFGRGTGEMPAASDPAPSASDGVKQPRRSEDTKPNTVLPTQQPWRSLAEENLGGDDESSLLETLSADADARRKRSAQS